MLCSVVRELRKNSRGEVPRSGRGSEAFQNETMSLLVANLMAIALSTQEPLHERAGLVVTPAMAFKTDYYR